jgi:ribose transport system substrate-binding protein
MKKIVVFVLVLFLVTGFLFAGGQKEKGVAPEEGEKVFTVGINNFGQANFFARIGRATMIEEIEKRGGVVISTVTADVPSRISAIEDFITRGVDAIIIQEGDINMAAPPLLEAKRKGIIIAAMGCGDADFVDIAIDSDDEQLGRGAAEAMLELIGNEGKIIEIINDLGAMIRVRKNAMQELVAQTPGAEVAWSFTYAWPDFFPDAKAKMEATIQANPRPGQIAAVFATFDGVGVAAAHAIKEAKLQDHIIVVGIDGDPEAFKEMMDPESPFKATMAQQPDQFAKKVVEQVWLLLEGKPIESRYVAMPGVLVTQDDVITGRVKYEEP